MTTLRLFLADYFQQPIDSHKHFKAKIKGLLFAAFGICNTNIRCETSK